MLPRWIAVPLLAALALATGCATDGAVRPDGPVIKDLKVEGTDALDEGDIKKKILTTETAWWVWLWPFAEKQYFDTNAWQADLRRIERYYQAQGYYDARVVEDRVIPDGDGVKLWVKVTEGKPTTIGTVEITGLDELPKGVKEDALDDLPLEEGDVFLEDHWAGIKGQLQQKLKDQGYAEAQVLGEVQVDLATKKAAVLVQVTPGRRYKFGNIFVASGARPKVPHKRVIEKALTAIPPGKTYSDKALAEAQGKVFQMGVFGGVKVNRGAPDREAGTVPVVIDVREAPFRTIELGAGGGVDLVRNELRATAAYTDRNFFGDLRRLTTEAKIGWAFIPNVYSVSIRDPLAQNGFIVDATAELEQPRLFHPDLSGQATVAVERGIEPAYSFIGGRTRAGVIWRPWSDVSIFPSYNFEGYRVEGATTLRAENALLYGCANRDAPPTGATQPCYIFLSFLEQVIEWDRRIGAGGAPDVLSPVSGFYLSASFQESLGGSFDYVRVVPEARGYLSFFENTLTVGARIQVGTLVPMGGGNLDTPITNRFFGGGGNGHRGFNNRRLSPVQRVEILDENGAPIPSDGQPATYDFVPIGGNALVETSVEARYDLNEDWALATFLDSGASTLDPLGGSILSNLQHAVGFGVRYKTMVGPIRVDLAYRLPLGGPLDVQGLPSPDTLIPDGGCFGFGSKLVPYSQAPAGAPEGRCLFHLSIGEAF